jgi:hypothetical protein
MWSRLAGTNNQLFPLTECTYLRSLHTGKIAQTHFLNYKLTPATQAERKRRPARRAIVLALVNWGTAGCVGYHYV